MLTNFLVKNNSNAKFEESIDVSLKINLKQSKGGDFNLRTTINLPNGSGKKVKVEKKFFCQVLIHL